MELYMADIGNNRIWKMMTLGGGGSAIASGLSGPSGVAVDENGNVYVTDASNRLLKEAVPTVGHT